MDKNTTDNSPPKNNDQNLPNIQHHDTRKKTRLGTAIESLNAKPKKEKPLFFVNILIREKKYRQYCGEGLQKIRWLTDCAIYKYENETKKTNLGIAYGLKNENGNLCDLNSRIIDNLENGANVLVLLKEEYESEMRERKKTGGKGNTNLTDEFLRQLKQFNNGYKFEYDEENENENEENENENEGDEFVDQEDNENEEDINDDQTLKKEMSKQQSKSINDGNNKNEEKDEFNLNEDENEEEKIGEDGNNTDKKNEEEKNN
jgi:hypothetical protein